MFPARGPSILRVTGVETPIAQGTLIAPTVGPVVVWQWRNVWNVTSLVVLVSSTLAADMANTEFAIWDQRGDMIVGGDGQLQQPTPVLGVNQSTIRFRPERIFQPFRRKFRLSRFVNGGDRWNIQFQARATASATVTPRLYFSVGDVGA